MQEKRDYEQYMLNILQPLMTHYSQDGAMLKVGSTGASHSEKIAGFEGFARPLWGVSPYYACIDEEKDNSFAEIYLKGLANGSNPDCNEYWSELRDRSQTLVEMPAIGLALLLAPEKLFYSLTEAEQNNLAEWLYQINNYECVNNNWQLFKVIVNIGLKNVNRKYSQKAIDLAFERMEEWYIGDGWYTDGKVSKRKDYYLPFAIYFYSLIYAKYAQDYDEERCRLIKERAKLFAQDYIYHFGKDGAAIPYGRSLTYRFAQISFWAALVWADASPFPLGVVKGIINRNLEYWKNMPICDNGGVLSIGYCYPNLFMSEIYNAPGSPYWTMKAFLFLALPKDHQFFKVKAEPLPDVEKVHTVKTANRIYAINDNHSVMYPDGQNFGSNAGCMHEKYNKFAYSSKYGFSVSRSNKSLFYTAPDSMLAFEVNDNIYVREGIKEVELIGDNCIKTKWSPVNGIDVETTITVFEDYHIREHLIQSEVDCVAYDCGFSIPKDGLNETAAENSVAVLNDDCFCKVSSDVGEPLIIDCAPNTNLVYPKTVIPAIKYEIGIGATTITTKIEA